MADVLLSQLQFVDVAAGGSATLPHGLNIEGIAEIPDFLWQNNPNFSLSADNVDVIVINNSDAIASVVVMCELPHSISRVFGVEGQESLAIRPFVPTVGVGAHRLAGPEHVADTIENLQDKVTNAVLAVLDTRQTFTKAQEVALVALSSVTNAVAIDGSLSNNYTLQLGENTTVENPGNVKAGQVINIYINQVAAFTAAWASAWLFPGGDPVVTPSAGANDLVSAIVLATDGAGGVGLGNATFIQANMSLDHRK